MHEDAVLVSRAKQGDSDAYEALMIRYERAAKVLALGILRDRDLADDVVQNAFIRAYEKLGTLRQGSRFAAWLMRIVKRQAVRACASGARWPHLSRLQNRWIRLGMKNSSTGTSV